MFTKRIIPCLDCKDGRVVKGTNFVDLRDAGDPVEVASMYDKSGADELVFLDITASSDGRNTNSTYRLQQICQNRTYYKCPYALDGYFKKSKQ